MNRSLRAGGAVCLGIVSLFLAHATPAAAQDAPTVTVTYPDSTQSSAPLWSAPPARASVAGEVPKEQPLHPLPQGAPVPGGAHANDRALQNKAGGHLAVEQRPAFQGIIQDGFVPSDQNIAVGQKYIVQVTNSEIAVFDKQGNMQPTYPKALSSLWMPLGGACAQINAGDPIVQYDALATPPRWIVTQLANLKSPYGECIAVSQTDDPEGSYNLFSYSFGSNLNDYPKFSVWPTTTNSAYFATYNLFANGNTFAGAALCAYDRAAMLAVPAAPAAQICTTVSDGGVLPSDLDGSTAPPDGEPGYFLDFDSLSTLALRTFAPNFAAVPPTATITSLPDLTVGAFSEACGGVTCIPQPGQGRKLDSLGDRLMYRLAYRNFGGGHESMVVNHSIVAGSSVGPRWYLLDSMMSTNNVANFSVKGQGTYAPDASYRWMGSIAMDQLGDMALGYSLSSTSIYPSIAVTGRLASDPIVNGIGNMGNEIVLLAGGGAQTGTNRWGDYSSMRIDPQDDCTFWYTNQYYPTTSAANWYTYIGAFRFSACGNGGSFTLSPPGTVMVNGGGSDSSSHVTVMPNGGFNSAVTLGATCVAPITCSFNPNPVPGGSTTSTVTVAVAANAPSGTTTETITGNSAGLIDSKTFLVDIPSAQFTLAASPTSTTIRAGSSGSFTITAKDVAAASGSTKSPVALTVDSSQLSSGIIATLNSNSINSNGGSTTVKITVPRGVPSGTKFSFTIKGGDGPPANNQTVTVSGTTR